MQKQEFEERIERTVTDEQYKVIEEVYMWHPSIRNTSGKDEVAELYKSFGMTIFHDMYCTVGEVLEMIKDDMKNVIIGDEYIEDEQEREAKIATLCESAISDACAEIDGYLAKRYRVPFTKTPQVINKFAKDISVYNLVSRTGIDESDREKTFLNRYNAAIKFLLDVAKGIISIGVEEKGGSSEAANGFKMKSSGRVFSRDSMRGW